MKDGHNGRFMTFKCPSSNLSIPAVTIESASLHGTHGGCELDS